MKRIATLNDKARKGLDCPTMITSMVQALSAEDRAKLFKLVRDFDDFNEGNDPYGEHDFGKVTFDGEDYFWKIDYYTNSLCMYGAEDPEDDKTFRVLAIMHVSEY